MSPRRWLLDTGSRVGKLAGAEVSRGELVPPVITHTIGRHGQYRAVVVNEGTLTGRPWEVLAGNHTLMAARSLDWERIDAAIVDVSDEDAAAIVLADNRLADLGGYDSTDLHALLSGLDSFDGTGYTTTDLAALEQALFPPVPRTDPDDAPSVPADPISQVGQVWALGGHRLLVGSSTDLDAVRQLCGDVQPDMVWTDPPYGVDYVGGKSHAHSPSERKRVGGKTIQNDVDAAALPELLTSAFSVVAEVCKAGAPVYIACPPGPEFQTFTLAMDAAELRWRQTLIWVKNAMVLGRSDYHYRHEPILYGFTPGGEGRLGRGGQRWQGDNKQTTVFEFDRPSRGGKVPDHPTMKPVALIAAMLANSLPPGGGGVRPVRGVGFDADRRARQGSSSVLCGARPALRRCDPAQVRGAHRDCSRARQPAGVVPGGGVSGAYDG